MGETAGERAEREVRQDLHRAYNADEAARRAGPGVAREGVGPIEPMPYIGWKAKTSAWAQGRGHNRLAGFLARWDERGLGR